jgi:hypothetical protein
VDDSSGPDDEIVIDPLPVPRIPLPRAAAVIAGRIPRGWRARNGRRPTWRGWLAAAIAAVVVIGALKLGGVIGASAPPRWVAALGPGVTVTGPEQVAPGHGSPGAALTGAMATLSQDPAAACTYAYPQCTAQVRQGLRNESPWVVSVKIGYVAISGTRALVGFTGKVCPPPAASPVPGAPECMTNANPAAIFSAGRTFATLWTQAISPANVTSTGFPYQLQPCVKVGGEWYVGTGSS